VRGLRTPDHQLSGREALILVSLADGDKHGYAMAQDIEDLMSVTISAGVLYPVIAGLVRDGMIVALRPSGRRRPYRITYKGRRAIAAQLTQEARIARLGLQRLRRRAS
jgi:DNA-binding PadR family transcriptional regulator